MFTSFETYERFLYQLGAQYASIENSTVVLIRRGRVIAVVRGDITFKNNIRLHVYEELTSIPRLQITGYGYEVYSGDEKLYWYDSQPHPNNPDLASTHPHHKHIPPDIKHHRVPAPGLTFTQP
ncbi:MAG: hypothetical protein HUU38_15125, partial [Anaerolineales bacterium]|nr:hypothetical protein [Anaerolineales bacterium]